jgi:microcystin-dependent protein
MSDPILGEIRIFAFTFPPRGWALCNGQLLQIAQNTALFSLLGTTYGGDGVTTFALPNLQGSAPLQQGQGAGLSPRSLGQAGGAAQVLLSPDTLPAHTHIAQSNSGAGDQASPVGNVAASATILRQGVPLYSASPGSAPLMNRFAVGQGNGGNSSHNNMPPYLTLLFCIALQGAPPLLGTSNNAQPENAP